jgi:NADPH:quinone reductase-like Zn-dependent oxidoreductase
MKAIAVNQFKTAPQLMELPTPAVKPGTLLIRIAAAGMNPFDYKMIDGILDGHMPHQFPLIMGVDGSGTVAAVGEGVTNFKEGDTIFGQFMHVPVGEGAYAEYVVVPADVPLAPAPHSISLEEAAGIPTGGVTAAQLLEKAGLKHEQTLLVIGGTGGVGLFLLQLAAMQGIYVIATVSDDEGASRVTELGAKETVNYRLLSVTERLRQKYPDGVDALIDLASDADTFKSYTALVKDGGVALTTNFVADKHVLKERNLTGGNFESKATPASLKSLADAIDNGLLQVPVQRTISLEEAPAAVEEMRKLKGRGKTIIKIS